MPMKSLLSFSFSFLLLSSHAQSSDWQQTVDYQINVGVDHQKNTATGQEKVVYSNHSHDTIRTLYFHLYWNAMKKGSHSFERMAEMGSNYSDLTQDDFGQIDVTSISVNSVPLVMDVYESIGKVVLKDPLLPGKDVVIDLQFTSKIPSCINRAGKNNRSGTDYTFTQWYPKLCRYDKQGWHTDPYFGREFAGTFGRFNVKIQCDPSFTVAGTGVLKNKKYVSKGWEEAGKQTKSTPTVWEFNADNVHDFAFAMDREWRHEQKRIDEIDFHFFYPEKNAQSWKNLIDNWHKSYAICKENFGTYPWPQFSFIQAGEGYMEYPMCTMLEGASDFYSTACHEFMHSYFYGFYGTDENLHHWMDEGLTTYAEARISNINGEVLEGNEGNSDYILYSSFGEAEPMATAANHFQLDFGYWNSAYFKARVFVELIQYMIGDETIRKGFGRYYNLWKFKHPEPNDFVKVMEDVSDMELTWFQNYWINTNQTINVGIDTIQKTNNGVSFTLYRNGIPMPLDVQVTYKDGSTQRFHIPLDLTNNVKKEFKTRPTILQAWSCGAPRYTVSLENRKLSEIVRIEVDPDGYLPENKEDNLYER
ncbi:MAG: hypothetical protein RIQ90_1915 [Bacteroidota bacterium]